ncbi:MAG: hypothetical protein IT460_16320 [Planctomycetes bacterium]|nr:hypothetical protein [Planctomycetota bacterium]
MERARPGRSRARIGVATAVALLALVATAVLVARERGPDDADEAPPIAAPTTPTAPGLAAPRAGTPPAPRRDADVPAPPSPVAWDEAPRAVRVVVLEPDGSPGRDRMLFADVGWAHADDAPTAEGWDFDVTPRRTDALGHARFQPAPSRGMRVRVAGHDDVVGGPVAVAPGREVVLRLRPRPWVTVTVTDADGAPVADAHVGTAFPWDQPPDADLAREVGVDPEDLGTFGALFDDDAWTWRPTSYGARSTDAAGRARVSPTLHGRACRLTVAPPKARGDLVATVLPRWTPRDETVVLYARRRVAGRVADAASAPVTEGAVRVEDRLGQARVARVEYDATYALEDVPDGPVTLQWLGGGDAAGAVGPPRGARAGDEDALVTADLGASLAVRVEGWPRRAAGEVLATREGGGPPERARADLDVEGRARLVGLRRDATYTLFVGPTPEQVVDPGPWRCARREGVRPGAEQVVLSLADGASIEGRVDAAGPAPQAGLSSGWAWVDEGGVVARAALSSDGRFALRGLPPGTYTVRAVRIDFPGWTPFPPDGFDVGETSARTGASDATVVLRHERRWEVAPALPRASSSGVR